MSNEQSQQFVNSVSDARTVNNTMRHQYRVLSEQEKADMTDIKDAGLAFLKALERLPITREIALAKTRTEEAVMWAVKSITK